MSEHDNLLLERRDAYLWITLNRPQKANALAVAMMEGKHWLNRKLKAAPAQAREEHDRHRKTHQGEK